MIASRTLQRANTIPEMALVLSLVMLTLFGVIQYALVGFNQIGSDGAAFVGDHAAVAQYNAPTQNNLNYVQQVAQISFPHSQGAYSASIQKNGTYEIDIASKTANLGLTQLFPSTVAQTSRIVEPSQSVVPSTGPPVGQCAQGALDLTYGGTTLLSGAAAPLLGNVSGDQIYQDLGVSGGTTLQLNLSALQDEDGTISAVSTDFKNLADSLSVLSGALNTISTTVPIVGPTVANTLTTTIQNNINPLVNSAVGGTYVSNGPGNTGAGVSLSAPLPAGTVTADLTATTNAVNAVESSNGANLLLTQLFGKVLNPALTSVEGNLSALNAAQTDLNALSNKVSKCV